MTRLFKLFKAAATNALSSFPQRRDELTANLKRDCAGLQAKLDSEKEFVDIHGKEGQEELTPVLAGIMVLLGGVIFRVLMHFFTPSHINNATLMIIIFVTPLFSNRAYWSCECDRLALLLEKETNLKNFSTGNSFYNTISDIEKACVQSDESDDIDSYIGALGTVFHRARSVSQYSI